MTPLRFSTPSEQPLQASKWLTVPAMLETSEFEHLLEALGDFALYLCGTVTLRDQGILPKKTFLEHYQAYIDLLKAGNIPEPASLQPWFSPAMTATTEALYAIPVASDKQLIRIATPVVQLQAHNIAYSPVDKKFRSMVFGTDNISWGIQFSYPQQYLDATTNDVIHMKNLPDYPNNQLFRELQKWMRQHTIPTPFLADNILQNVPMRIGKQCLPWINLHPQLINKEIKVKNVAN